MEFRVLGPLEVRRAGEVVDVRGSKRRALLALLILHANEVIPSERLIDELWGGRPPANASAALHNLVWRLRKDLGSELLVTKPWGYLLRIDPETVDLHRFDLLVRDAKPLPAGERRAKLAEALGLWRGPALTGLEHEPSLSVEIARLQDLRLVALEQRIDADLELGAHEEVVPELEALVGEHPLRERPRGQLILALYGSGRQAEALEACRETRRVLVDELGIEPSPELRELERAILRQDPALASSTPVEPAEMVAGPPPRSRWPRSPLVIAAGLGLLAAGGATAGLLLTEGAHSHPVAKRPGSATPHYSTVSDLSATGATPAGTRAKHRAAERHRSVTRHPKRKPAGHPPTPEDQDRADAAPAAPRQHQRHRRPRHRRRPGTSVAMGLLALRRLHESRGELRRLGPGQLRQRRGHRGAERPARALGRA
jgi:DNA-binding SARP family transcriptional activator